MPQINAARLLADLHALREFGSARARGFPHPTPEGRGFGVVRPTFCEADMESRRWLAARFEEAGLEATVDGVANVLGRSRNPGPALLLGSHSDTQPKGGWLDGAMGVVFALECARALAEEPATAHLAVDCASWADEVGAPTPSTPGGTGGRCRGGGASEGRRGV